MTAEDEKAAHENPLEKLRIAFVGVPLMAVVIFRSAGAGAAPHAGRVTGAPNKSPPRVVFLGGEAHVWETFCSCHALTELPDRRPAA